MLDLASSLAFQRVFCSFVLEKKKKNENPERER